MSGANWTVPKLSVRATLRYASAPLSVSTLSRLYWLEPYASYRLEVVISASLAGRLIGRPAIAEAMMLTRSP